MTAPQVGRGYRESRTRRGGIHPSRGVSAAPTAVGAAYMPPGNFPSPHTLRADMESAPTVGVGVLDDPRTFTAPHTAREG